jgi:hypothetical protein
MLDESPQPLYKESIKTRRDDMTMNVTTVKDIIKARGTRFATVTFIKKDGSERVANGLFRPSSKIVGSERGFEQSERMKQLGLIPFYDLKKGAWISFYQTAVKEIR